MSDDRQPFSALTEMTGLAIRLPERGRTEFEDIAYKRGELIIYRPADGKNSYIATVSEDDIFDRNGNRFYHD